MTHGNAAGPTARGTVRELFTRLPVTAGAVTVIALGAVASAALSGLAAIRVRPTLQAGLHQPIWTWLTSGLVSRPSVLSVIALLAVPVVLGLSERRLGRWTLAGLLGGQVLGTALGLGIVAAIPADAIWGQQLSRGVVLGPVPGVLAVLGMATSRMSALWRRRVRVLLSVGLLAMVLYSGTPAHLAQLAGWSVGLAGGAFVRRSGHHPIAAVHPTRREGRALVALVLAAAAVGPLIAVLSQAPGSPLAVLSHLFVFSRPSPGLLHSVCGAGGDTVSCQALRAQGRVLGPGATTLSVLPVVLQLMLAEGLRRGRRAAWLAAVGLTGLLTVAGSVIAAILIRRPSEILLLLHLHPGSQPASSVIVPLFAPVLVLVLLLSTGSLFRVRAAPGTGRRWLLAAGAGLAAVTVSYVVIGWLLRREFSTVPSPAGLLLDLPQRMLPPGYLGEFLPPLVPLRHARMLVDWAGVAAWAVLIVTAVRLVRPAAPAGDAVRARSLVQWFGDGPLSYMTTWAGNRYWFTPDRRAMVAYRVHGGVALTTGNPVGEPDTREAAVHGFADWCADHGWTPCWYGVTDEVKALLAEAGMGRVQIASETWLPLGSLEFSGRRWQDIRTAVNRAGREGVAALWTRWSDAPLALREQIAVLSEEWLAVKGLPEMGFTLGGLDELADDEVRCLLAVDKQGRVHGLTSWLPAYREGTPVGWILDVMRRGTDASPGTMEFLIATAAMSFQDEGAEWVSLSGAPLALPPDVDRSALTGLLDLAGRAMEPVYGFRSLLAFKAKFQPRHRPLWLLYPAAADLPRIARAVSHAYLPHLSPIQAARLALAVLHGHRAASQRRAVASIQRSGSPSGPPPPATSPRQPDHETSASPPRTGHPARPSTATPPTAASARM